MASIHLLTTWKTGKHDPFISIARVWPHSNFHIVYRRTKHKSFESENDVISSAININTSRFPIFYKMAFFWSFQ